MEELKSQKGMLGNLKIHHSRKMLPPLLGEEYRERSWCYHVSESGPLGGSLARQPEPGPPREELEPQTRHSSC